MQLSTSSIQRTSQPRCQMLLTKKGGWRQVAQDTSRMATAYTQPAGSAVKHCTLPMSLDVADVLYEEKKDFMKKKFGLKEPVTFLLSPHVPPTKMMMGFLRLRELKGMDGFLLKPVFKDDLWDIKSEPGSEDNERAVCATMVQVAREAISRHSSTIEDDRALLQGGTLQPGSPEEAAVKARLGDLECLQYIADWFEQRAARLSQLPYYEKRRLRRLGIIDYGQATETSPTQASIEDAIGQDALKCRARLQGHHEKETVSESNFFASGFCATVAALLACLSFMAALKHASFRMLFYQASSIFLCCSVFEYSCRFSRASHLPAMLADWLKLRQLRKMQGQPDLFLRDASHIFPHCSAGYLFDKCVDMCRTFVYAQRMAEFWPLALAATYIMIGNTGFWRDWQYVLIVPFWLYFLFIWYRSRYAFVVLSNVSKRRAESMSAKNAKDPMQSPSEPVRVGFFDNSMSLPVFRYLFRCC